MLDGSRPISEEDRHVGKKVVELASEARSKVLCLVNKSDIPDPRFSVHDIAGMPELDSPPVSTSALRGTGLSELRNVLRESVLGRYSQPVDRSVTVTNTRHYAALRSAKDYLEKGDESLRSGMSGEFVAVDLRGSIDRLGEIIGVVTTEDILNGIFSRFCIGK